MDELLQWLCAFQHCRHTAYYHVPQHVYVLLCDEEYITIHHDVTEKGHQLIKELS